jgi:hypothetical protein
MALVADIPSLQNLHDPIDSDLSGKTVTFVCLLSFPCPETFRMVLQQGMLFPNILKGISETVQKSLLQIY